MPDEDQNPGTLDEAPSTPEVSTDVETSQVETPSAEPSEDTSVEVPHDETKINTVGAALEAFKRAREGTTAAKPPGTATPKPPQARDFSGLTPEETSWFKNMGNQAFANLKPVYLEAKRLREENEQLKKSLNDASQNTIYEHPEAYQFTPEFKSYSQNAALIDQEINHWRQQLASARAGEAWTPIVLDNEGKPVLGEPREASPEAESQIIDALTRAHAIKTDLGNKIQGIQGSFKTHHQAFVGKLNEITDKIFEGADKKQLEAAMNTKLPLFPSIYQNRPEIKALATTLAVIDGLVLMLNQAKSSNTTAALRARTTVNAGPAASSVQTPAGKVNNTVGAALADFQKYKSQHGF